MRFGNIAKLHFTLGALLALFLPLSRALLSLFSFLFLLIWVLEGGFAKKLERIRSSKALGYFLLFLLFLLLSLLWSQNLQDAMRPLRFVGYMFVLVVIATSLHPRHTQKLLSLFLVGMLVSEILTYGIFFGWWQINDATPKEPSPFMMHIDYSIFLAFSGAILLYRLFSTSYSLKERLFYALFFLTVTGNLFITNGRTGQVAFLLGLFVLALLRFRSIIKALLVASLLFGTIFVGAYATLKPFTKRVDQAASDILTMQEGNFNSSLGIRAAYHIAVFEILKEHPLLGVGLGDYKTAIKEELKKPYYTQVLHLSQGHIEFMGKHHPHSQYLLILLQSGIVGLVAFLLFIYAFFRLPIANKEIKDLSILFMTIFAVGCLPEPLLFKQFTVVLFSFFGGLFIANSLKSKKLTQGSS